jgi:hypothetical protein
MTQLHRKGDSFGRHSDVVPRLFVNADTPSKMSNLDHLKCGVPSYRFFMKEAPLPTMPDVESTIRHAIRNVDETYRAVGDFVLTEVKLGLEFADRAVSYAADGRKAESQRNMCAAKKAYEEIMRFLPKAMFRPGQAAESDENLVRLKSMVNGNPVS